MNSRGASFTGFILGFLAGLGVGYFSSSKEGKKVLRKFKKQMKPYVKEFCTLFENKIDSLTNSYDNDM